jgi:hypothetical protein
MGLSAKETIVEEEVVTSVERYGKAATLAAVGIQLGLSLIL